MLRASIGNRCALPRQQPVCNLCGIAPRDGRRAEFCRRCRIANRLYRTYGTGQAYAVTKVASAIKQGLIKPAAEHSCVDCGAKADHYEHRDYNQPLEVEPVCRSCNEKRGYAIPKAMTFKRFLRICSGKREFKQYLSPEAMEPIRRKYWPNEDRQGDNMPTSHKPHRLLDTILTEQNIKNDHQLSIALGLGQPALSKVRHGVNPVSAELMIRLHKKFGMPIARIESLAGLA